MKRNLFILILLLANAAFSQLTKYTFADLEQRSAAEVRFTVIYLSAPWCKFCGMMEQTTFKNDMVINILNDDYHFVAFSSENNDPIRFNGRTYEYHPTGNGIGSHEIITELLSGLEISFPAIIILDKDLNIVFRQTSFIDAEHFITILNKIKS
jgi:thioredoxin-related protein